MTQRLRLRVVELCGDSIASCAGMHLASAGATVLKIEPFEGDALRGWEPRRPDGHAAAFAEYNRGKRSVALGSDDSLDAPWLRRLIHEADVVLCSLPGWGVHANDLVASQPRLVVGRSSPFGAEGEWAGYAGSELAAQALSDTTGSLGRIGEPPVRLGADAATVNAATFLCQGVLAALIDRERSGLGQIVDTSGLGAMLSIRNVIWTALSDPDDWWGFHLDSWTRPPEHGYQTATDPIFFNLWRGDSEDWDRLLIALGLLDAAPDHRFGEYGRQAAGTGRYASELKGTWEQALAAFPAEDAIRVFKDAHANVTRVHTYASLFADPHFPFLEMLAPVDGSDTACTAVPWNRGTVEGPIPQLDEFGQQARAGRWP